MYYVFYFLAGVFTAGGVPHFIKGITGEQHETPFGLSSSAVSNVVWGSFNFLIALVLWHYAGTHRSLAHTLRYEIVFLLGGFIIALVMAQSWSQKKSKSSKS